MTDAYQELKSMTRRNFATGVTQFTNERPADYWAERGYDWYLGH